jgi:hypothetical protein
MHNVIYMHVYTLSFAMHVLGELDSGSSSVWGKTDRRSRFGYFEGGELKTTNPGSGMGMHSSVHPHFYGFWSTGVGVLLCDWRT